MTTHRPAYWAAISLIIAFIALMTLDSGSAQAKMFKYRDDQGKLHFTDDKNKIPLQYQSDPETKEFRGVTGSSTRKTSTPASSSGVSDGGTKPGSTGSTGSAGTGEEQVGLSEEDTKLAEGSIAMLQKGVDLANANKGSYWTFVATKKIVTTPKANLSAKESLAADLAKSKVPELKATQSFLQKSISLDKTTNYPMSDRPTLFRRILNRVVSEGPPQEALIISLNQALKDSEKAKAAAEKKKEQEQAQALPGKKK